MKPIVQLGTSAPVQSTAIIALHLPQFHPIPENDAWWGRGFTEWTNVTRATPSFRGHYQPHLPADLGFYDLRLPEARAAQAELAAAYGISGFCYYHYWFNGRRILNRPVDEILRLREPAFPFCLCWANENWTRSWDGREREVLLPQSYSLEDAERHIQFLLRIFEDDRYIKIDGMPFFSIYRARAIPDIRRITDLWRQAAVRAGWPGLFLCRVEGLAEERGDPLALGFDSAIEFQPDWATLYAASDKKRRAFNPARRIRDSVRWKLGHRWTRFDYAEVADMMMAKPVPSHPCIPCLTPGWDNTPRRGRSALIIDGSSPALFGNWLAHTIARARRSSVTPDMVFVNAWNEWAEGAHLEPCHKFGTSFLEQIRAQVSPVGLLSPSDVGPKSGERVSTVALNAAKAG